MKYCISNNFQTFFEFLWRCISVRSNRQFWEIIDQSVCFCNFINICQLADYTKLTKSLEFYQFIRSYLGPSRLKIEWPKLTTGQAIRVLVIFLIFCLPVNYEFVIFFVPKYLCKVMRSVLHIHLVHLVYHHVSIRLKLIYRRHNQPIQYPKIKYLNS